MRTITGDRLWLLLQPHVVCLNGFRNPQAPLTQQIRGQRQNDDPIFRALNYGPHTFINTPNVGSLTVTVLWEYLVELMMGKSPKL